MDGSVEEGLGKKRMMRDSNGRGKRIQSSSCNISRLENVTFLHDLMNHQIESGFQCELHFLYDDLQYYVKK